MGDFEEGAPRRPVRIWIESPDGSIARGVVEVLSADGALVELAEAAGLSGGAEVSVRLSLDPNSPTLGLVATVLWVSSKPAAAQCEVEWQAGSDSAEFRSLITALGQP